jgi:hypothetical protein
MRCVLIVSAFAFLIGSQQRALAGDKASLPFRVVVLGSSTAAGEAARPLDSSWVNKYRLYLGTILESYEVVNLAVGGYTTFNIMPSGTTPPSPYNISKYQPVTTNNISYALALSPNLIIINMPTNDCADYIPVSQQIANYNRVLQDADYAGVPVWITTTQPRNLDDAGRALLISMRDATWSNYPSRTIDFWTGLASSTGTILPAYDYDGTHVNNAGHEILFERVVNTVSIVLPIRATPSTVTFSDQRAGTSSSLPLTLTNTTASSITISSITTDNGAFTPDKTSGVIAAGGSMSLNVTFAPGSVGYYSDTLSVYNSSAKPIIQIPLMGNSPLATVTPSKTSISFGDVALLSTSTTSVTLSTSSLNNAAISGVSFVGAGFSANPTSGTVTPSTPLTLQVSFTPNHYGSFSDTLKIAGVFANSVLAIPVSGNSPTPVLTPDPVALNFGDVTLNTSKSLDLKLGNATLNTLSIDGIVTTKSQYYVNPSSGSVPAAGSLTVSVQFMPTAFGEVLDTIQIFTNASGTPVRVPIRGNSPSPTIALSRSQIAFPEIGRGDVVTRSVTLYNQGSSSLSVQSFSTKTQNFSVPKSTPFTVGALDSVTFDVRYGPDTTGDIRDTLTITTNAGAKTLPLSGTVLSSILTTSSTKVNFGTYKVGTSGWRTMVLHVNTTDGSVTARVDSVRLYRNGYAVYGFSSPVTLHRTDSLSLTIEFHPASYITYRDTLHIYNNTVLSVIHVPLEGIGGTTTDVSIVAAGLPEATALLQNYPNPFNPSTNIRYQISDIGYLKLTVYDMLGREVAVLVNERKEPGTYSVTWNAAGMASGMYVYRMEVRDLPAGSGKGYIQSRTLLLLK